MSSTRFDDAMKAAVVEEARSVWTGAKAKAEARPGRRWVMVFGGALGLLLVGRWIQGSPEGSPSRLAFGPETVVSAQSQGLGGGVEAMLPPDELEGVSAEAAETRGASASSPGVVAATPATPAPPKCAACEAAAKARAERAAEARARAASAKAAPEASAEHEDVFEDSQASPPPAAPSPSPSPAGPTTLNVGSQFEMALDLPVLTGAATTPVAAHLVDDVKVGERVVIPAGSRIVGEAFSTTEDDRAQIVLTAVVVNGKTIQLHGLALGQDSAFGVAGKIVRKGSAPKAGVGKVLGSVGRALSFGLIGSGSSSTLAGAAAYGVESAAGGELQGLDQRWRRSDKIIRVESGTRARVYLRSDLVV